MLESLRRRARTLDAADHKATQALSGMAGFLITYVMILMIDENIDMLALFLWAVAGASFALFLKAWLVPEPGVEDMPNNQPNQLALN